MVPAAYLHFSDAVLRTTRHCRCGAGPWWSCQLRLSACVLVLLALFTDLLVYNGAFTPPIDHLAAGPLFPLFVAYFVVTAVYGAWNVIRARRRCLTPGLAAPHDLSDDLVRRARAGRLSLPGHCRAGSSGLIPHPVILLLMVMAANIAVGTMLVLMAYSVTYLGVLSPDRVIKHDLVHYLLRGPGRRHPRHRRDAGDPARRADPGAAA